PGQIIKLIGHIKQEAIAHGYRALSRPVYRGYAWWRIISPLHHINESACGGSHGKDELLLHRGAQSCSSRSRRSYPRTSTTGLLRCCLPTQECGYRCGLGTSGREK